MKFMENLPIYMEEILNFISKNQMYQSDACILFNDQLKACAQTALDVQEQYPLTFGPYLKKLMTFFDQCCTKIDKSQFQFFNKFLIKSMNFLRSVIECEAYCSGDVYIDRLSDRDKPESPDMFNKIRDSIEEFWANGKAETLSEHIVSHFFPLSPKEVSSWAEDPETYVLECDEMEADSVRSEAQKLLGSVIECRKIPNFALDLVGKTVEMQWKAFASISPDFNVLLVDSVYLCFGINVFSLNTSNSKMSEFLKEILFPETEKLLGSKDNSPPVLLRRCVWLIGCSASYLDKELTKRSISIFSAVINKIDKDCDAAVHLAALASLSSFLELLEVEGNDFLSPEVLSALTFGIFSTFQNFKEMESRQRALVCLSSVIESAGHNVVPLMEDLINALLSVWGAAERQTPLVTSCIDVLISLLKSVESSEDLKVRRLLEQRILPVIADSTNLSRESLDPNLTDAGLSLWLRYLYALPEYSEPLHRLGSQLLPLLRCGEDRVLKIMLILEAYLVLGKVTFLSDHGMVVLNCVRDFATHVKPSCARAITRVLSLIQVLAPVEGNEIIIPLLPSLVKSTVDHMNNVPGSEIRRVVVQHVYVVSRAVITAPEKVSLELEKLGVSGYDFVMILVALFDNVSHNFLLGKVWCWAAFALFQQLPLEQLSFDEMKPAVDDIFLMAECVSRKR
eukprot:CAMPEP_0171455946 /NCGR_PEP_ID=MMETSP0945-20130129/2635_1 /TAXON_ID=109269 /ORGANISM="Vaucheria litorea, Strain CCMP2940" /LENGTH=679 /DNA_ID=CAMNT_0011981283 /DNA_START=718 /DNA_END=2754 /DNA_ORIENTATION=-